MKKSPSFWAEGSPPETAEELSEYIRPRSKEELTSLLAPSPPDPFEEPAPPKPVPESSILEETGLSNEEFVELALQQPELWSPEELEYLHSVLDGASTERLKWLATEFFYGMRQPPDPREAPPRARQPELLDLSLELPPDLPDRVSELPDLEELKGTESYDKWWEKPQ